MKLNSQPGTRYTSIALKHVSGACAEAAQTWLPRPRSRRPLASSSAEQQQEVLTVGVSSGRQDFALSAALEAAGWHRRCDAVSSSREQ
jgi:hypothetical protein